MCHPPNITARFCDKPLYDNFPGHTQLFLYSVLVFFHWHVFIHLACIHCHVGRDWMQSLSCVLQYSLYFCPSFFTEQWIANLAVFRGTIEGKYRPHPPVQACHWWIFHIYVINLKTVSCSTPCFLSISLALSQVASAPGSSASKSPSIVSSFLSSRSRVATIPQS